MTGDADSTELTRALHVDAQGGILIDLHVQPGARKAAVLGLHAGRIKLAIVAPPVEGKANDALVRHIAATLDVPRKWVTLASGRRSRDKCVRVDPAAGLDVEAVARRVASALR